MNKGRKLAILMAAAVAVNMCSVQADAGVKKLKVTNVSGSKKVMYVGKSFKIKTNYSVKKLTFKSSKTSVAKVGKTGVVKAKKAGKAYITIKAKNGQRKKIKILVKKAKTTVTSTPKVSTKPKVTTKPELPIETLMPQATETVEPVSSIQPTTAITTDAPIKTTIPKPTESTIVTPTASPNVSESPQFTITPTDLPMVTNTVLPTKKPVHTKKPITTPILSATPITTPTSSVDPITTLAPSAQPSITSIPSAETTADPKEYVEPLTADYKEKTDGNTTYKESEATKIQLDGNSAQITGNGAVVEASTVTITAEGTYILSGTLEDGQIIVNIEDTTEEPKVHLILDGVSISCSNNAPLVFTSADKVIMTLAEGTTNKVSDGTTYNLEEGKDEPDAAIYSKVALSINGTGSLEVEGNYSKGIKTKDNLKILGGNISIDAKDTGIVGHDMLGIWGGTITINAKGDGLKSTNDEKATKGYVYIAGGKINITAVGDGISAETSVYIKDTDITIKETGTDTTNSHKGIKAGTTLYIESGNVDINSVDDALHSDGCIKIEGGNINISCGSNVSDTPDNSSSTSYFGNPFLGDTNSTSGADGIHADGQVYINGGNIDIAQAYEGIEGAIIHINGGDIKVKSSDDGLNASDGTTQDGGMMMPGGNWGMTQKNPFSGQTVANCTLNISGGNLYVDASGDGLDANGSIFMTDGTVIVSGSANGGNGALDYDSEFAISGGTLAAIGSSGMAQAPSSTSSQCSIMANVSGQAGTLIHVQDEDGNSIINLKSGKSFGSVVISTPKLVSGKSYQIYTGGTIEGKMTFGTEDCGIYAEDAVYAAETNAQAATTVQASTAPAGNNGGGFNGGGNKPSRPW